MKWAIDVGAPVVALGDLVRKLPVAVERVLHKQGEALANKAQTVHRYKRRTGALQGATVAKATKMEIEGYIDESKAYYGKFVHEGHHSWAPDRFLTDAFASAENSIIKDIDSAISASIMNAGLA